MDMQSLLVVSYAGPIVNGQCGNTWTIPGGQSLVRPQSMAQCKDTTPIFKAGPGSDHIFKNTDFVGKGGLHEKISFSFMGWS